MSIITDFWKLTRLGHAIIAIIGVLVGEIIVLGNYTMLPLNATAAACIAVFLISLGIFALNDYLDYNADKANRRTDRPLVKGMIPRKIALNITIVAVPLGIIASYLASMIIGNYMLLAIVFAYALLSIAYNCELKNIPILGNMIVALGMALPFTYGNLVVSPRLETAPLMLTAIAFVFGMGREIIKSIQDMHGDKLSGRNTLPIKIGALPAAFLASLLLIITVCLSVLPYFWLPAYYNDSLYLGFIVITDLLALYCASLAVRLKHLKRIRMLTLAAMLTALVAFLLGAIY